MKKLVVGLPLFLVFIVTLSLAWYYQGDSNPMAQQIGFIITAFFFMIGIGLIFCRKIRRLSHSRIWALSILYTLLPPVIVGLTWASIIGTVFFFGSLEASDSCDDCGDPGEILIWLIVAVLLLITSIIGLLFADDKLRDGEDTGSQVQIQALFLPALIALLATGIVSVT